MSDDSHGPQAVALHYEDAHKYLLAANVKELYYLTNRPQQLPESTAAAATADEHASLRLGARRNTRIVKMEQGWSKDAFWQRL